MPVALQSLCSFLLMLYVVSVLSVCDVRVRTVDFGCHLDWECPDATPHTTYTVQSKANGASWKKVSDCIQISRHNCDLSNVFTNLHSFNYIRLSSEGLHDWMSEAQLCDAMNGGAATFSPPSINISTENGSLWVTLNFPCAPSISCRFKGEESEEEMDTLCPCHLSEFTTLSVTVVLYNKHKPSDKQIRSAQVMDEKPFREEFGFVLSGQVYCVVANFTSEFEASSLPSPPQCISIPAKIESLAVVIVCAVLIVLGLVFILLWRQCSSPERPLPKSLALLYDQEIQNETFIDSSKTASDRLSSESDRISVVSLAVFTHMDNQSYYHSSQSLGNGYYRSPILHDPGSTEESSGGLHVESGGLETDGSHSFELLQTAHLILERCPHLDECDKILNIPLSSVRVKRTEETTTDVPEQFEDQVEEESWF
ncbi:uncharacterized protein si:dkeyp-75h12.7 isoform X2 [Triplophysa rosa]|uniref:Fibronectin type-III domain-containing protein n=2 Tax=Triplophysa rosa TaxID=992332 RepID=A0A9W8CBJ3_TRIRA|nr:uncharacterized protein si:dkeyp-75h12.7 isoform X2 [Triplophysa rosa]KAI7814631.1 hypothetical protein IRJ41_023058 [Triplophysa rosa]